MNKAFANLALTIAATLALLTSCIEDTGNHMTVITYPQGYAIVYADQTLDSIFYETTEAHRVVPVVGWIEIDDTPIRSVRYVDNVLYELALPVIFQPNTTGKTRVGNVSINAGEYTAATAFLQTRFLNVERPYRYVSTDYSKDSLVTVTDSAFVLADSIVFTAYGNWTLTPKHGTWLQPQTTAGTPGRHTVMLALESNATLYNRTDTIVLESNGVAESIPVLQLGHRGSN